MKPSHLDLFSGIGGFALAAQWAGFETIQFVENNLFCQKVLTKNFPNIPIHSDIKDFEWDIFEDGEIDLLTGGFPCQPFSIAGKRKGKEDDRYLWPEMLRVIQESRPVWVLAENVTGIINTGLERILKELEAENYNIRIYNIPACGADAPHRRERLWIVAHSNGERCNLRGSSGEERYLQNDKKWNLSAIQSEWEKFKPITWKTFKGEDWLIFNTGISRANDGVSDRLDGHRIKALGNAIVPQVAFPILRLIRSLI